MGLKVLPHREATCPGKRPVGERRLWVACLDLDGTPEREHLVREMQSDCVETGDRLEPGVAQDECAR